MPRAKEGKKGVTIYLDDDLYKYAKKAAVDEESSLSNLIEGLVKGWRARRPDTQDDKRTKQTRNKPPPPPRKETAKAKQ